ncbi:Hsp70 family protein [Verrucomicrobium spinosum]|uniref:Hsp70 family protein n=1 Tax=Verrucomicrobium spinosum TaxID=2736 RepID=UPI00210C3986|nr:Hsp70 family protein [Verrucomicrobium spinosum]
MGAVIQAGILAGSLRQVVLLDVTPLSLGIETFGGLMNVIIPRNSTLPCKAGRCSPMRWPTSQRCSSACCRGNGSWPRTTGTRAGGGAVPGRAQGQCRVGVQFAIDANGILQVLARDTVTQVDTVLEIQNSAVDVEDARVEQMIAESVDFAFEDMNERIWTEARLKSEELTAAVDEALIQCEGLLEPAETVKIRECNAEVRRLLGVEPHDARALKAANQALDDATQTLAVLLVERAMEAALERKLGI